MDVVADDEEEFLQLFEGALEVGCGHFLTSAVLGDEARANGLEPCWKIVGDIEPA